RAHDCQADLVRRTRTEGDIGATARLAIRVEQFVAADRVDRIGRGSDEMVDGIRIALAPQPLRVRAEREALARFVDLDAAGMLELALAEHDVAEDEKAAGRALDRDLPLERRIVAG